MADATATNLDARREAALARVAELELPSFRGAAGWEFTPIDKLDLDAFPVAPGGTAPSSFGLDEAPPEGAIVMPLAQAAEEHPELVERHLGSIVDGNTPLVARNDAHWTDGTFVYVPRGVTVEAPIVISTAHEQAGSALHWRLLVVLEEDAQASVWHESSSAADGLVNGVVEVVVGPERAPAPGRPAGPRGDDVGLRHASAPSSAATPRWTGSRSASARPTARSSRRPSSPAPARTAASPAPTPRAGASTSTSTRCRSTRRPTRPATSPSAASWPTARARCGAG